VAILNATAAEKAAKTKKARNYIEEHVLNLPNGPRNLVFDFLKVPPLNVYDNLPALKIMETEDVYQWIDYVFGMEGDGHVLKRIDQKDKYQIIHLNPLICRTYVDYLDKFYVDLDIFGALWIEKRTEQTYRRCKDRSKRTRDLYKEIKYHPKPHENCWQIQYAYPDTPKRIFHYPEKHVKKDFPEAVEVNYLFRGEPQTGYIVNEKPRPIVEMTPFIPEHAF
jgi:hypothetical protein